MEKRSILKYISLDDLKLDVNNPRFGELYNGSKEEEDLIEYLLYDEAAEEIAQAIVKKNEFYEDKALWVIKDSEGKYIVRDGNRRCAAVKALQMPGKFQLNQPKTIFKELPVYEYIDENELKARISEEHSASLFRSWERIAKALQILDLADSGKQEEMNSLDSRPGDFIKLGSFYKEAVKYGGDAFRIQLRRGRGKTGGKTIIYERLFRDSKLCGYRFRNSPSYNIEITNKNLFEKYIKALVKYIETFPTLKTSDIDNNKDFIKLLTPYGFDAYPAPIIQPIIQPAIHPSAVQNGNSTNSPTTVVDNNKSGQNNNSTQIKSGSAPTDNTGSTSPSNGPTPTPAPPTKRVSIKKYPQIKRKQLPLGLKARIDEYFNLDSTSFPNAKIAMARVLYECILKYVVENTKSKNILLKNSGHFGSAYSRKPYTNFEEMNKKFIDLIINPGTSQAFNNFEFEKMHTVIHNYKVAGMTLSADQIRNNLIELIEFMLQDSSDLLTSFDLSKIK